MKDKYDCIHEDELKIPSGSFRVHLIKGVQGTCSFTDTDIGSGITPVLSEDGNTFIFASEEFIRSDRDITELENFLPSEVDSSDEDEEGDEDANEEEEKINKTLSEYSDVSQTLQVNNDTGIRRCCGFCNYISASYVDCIVYGARNTAFGTDNKKDCELVGNRNRIKTSGLILCAKCVDRIRERLAQYISNVDAELLAKNI